MYQIQSLILLFLLSIFVLTTSIFRIKKVTIFLCVQIVFFLYFCLTPLLLISLDMSSVSNLHIIKNIDFENTIFLSPIWSFLFFYSCLLFFYRLFTKENNRMYTFSSNKMLLMKGCAHFFFIIGLFSIIIYTRALNGPLNAIINAEYMRSPYAPDLGLTFIKLVQPTIVLSCYIYFIVVINKRSSTINKFMFAAAFLVSIYYFIIYAGRLPLFIFLSSFIFFYFTGEEAKKRSLLKAKKLVFYIIIGMMGTLILLSFDNVFNQLANANVSSDGGIAIKFKKAVVEFSFPYVNNLNVRNNVDIIGGYRWFSDFVIWIVRIIPNDFLILIGEVKPLSLNQVNTELLGTSLVGGIPADIISMGFYQLNYVGILINSLVIAWVISYFDRMLENIEPNGIVKFLKIKLCLYLPFVLIYADPDTSIVRRIDTLILLLLIRVLFIKKSNKLSRIKS